MPQQMKLNAADLAATNARVRHGKLKRRKMRCEYCERYVMCSTRLKACFVCFWGEKLQLKSEAEGYFDDDF
jgi:hypothetical protein